MWPPLALAVGILAHFTSGNLGAQAPRDHPSMLLFARVRSADKYMVGLIGEGYDRSSTFRELVDFLHQTNVIVSIQPIACAGGRIRSCVVGVKGSDRERHIWIRVNPAHTIRDRLIATVAHELQHAVEIAEHPDVIDGPSVLKLYRNIAVGPCGRGVSEECETTRALAAEERVLVELSKKRSRHE